jgi:two-component system, response regulator YesN
VIRAVIVDDEPDVIDGMRSAVDWSGLGITVVADASDGISALQVVADEKPDILLTDIRMAGANGLSLIESSRKILPDLVSIIFTGHSEYSYAKAAVSLGVSEFLEKPVSVAILESALLKAKEESLARQRARKATDSSDRAERVVKLERLKRVLLGWHSTESEPGEPVEPALGQFASAICATVSLPTNGDAGRGRAGQETDVESVISENLSGQDHEIVLYGRDLPVTDPSEITVVLVAREGRISRARLAAMFSRMAEHLQELMPGAVVGVGQTVSDEDELRDSYLGAREAARYGSFSGGRPLVLVEDMDPGHKVPAGLLAAHNDVLLAIRSGERERAAESTRSFLAQLGELEVEPDLVCHECLSLVVSALKTADESGLSSLGDAQNQTLPHQRITQLRTFDEISGWVTSTIDRIMGWLKESAVSRHRAVNVAMDYLNSRYSSDVSLQEIADLVGMNPSYLSMLFHKETGATYLQYLTRVRLEHSKQLMDQGMKVGAACRAVGYFDGRHFSSLFRKHFGIMPGEYVRHSG